MKKCTKCREFKPLSDYFNDKSRKDDLYPWCKQCCNKKFIEYGHTKNGLLTQMYATQRNRSKNRNYKLPVYSKKELRNWLFSQKSFHTLYDNWVKSDFNKWLRPSIDRKDDYKSYTLDNIQITTWRQNNGRSHDDMRNGINNKRSKSILQYDLDSNFIKEYYSLSQAKRETRIDVSSIIKVCKNKRKTAGKFVWKYKPL